MKKRLDKNVTYLFFLQNIFGLFFFLSFFSIFCGSFSIPAIIASRGTPDTALSMTSFAIWGLILPLVAIVVVFVLSYIFAVLQYKNYFYELTEDAFRKEYGVLTKKYVSIPYEKIQNVDIYRGIWARLLGLSDLNIQTAGASVQQVHGEGRLPGLSVADAETLRDELIRRCKTRNSL